MRTTSIAVLAASLVYSAIAAEYNWPQLPEGVLPDTDTTGISRLLARFG